MATAEIVTSAGGRRLLTKRELSRIYGFSERWVEYQLVKGMPSRLIGGRRRFDLDAVDLWLRAEYEGER